MCIGFWLLVRSENQMLSACVMVRPADDRDTSPTLKSSRNGPSLMARMLAAPRTFSRCGNGLSFNRRAERDAQNAQACMHFRVAIRAKHHAALELLLDLLPAPIDAVN